MNYIFVVAILSTFSSPCIQTSSFRKITEKQIQRYKQRVSAMFYHAYEGYLKYAYPYDELRPLTCDGFDTWGSYSLTLIDAMDTLVVLGNHSEFRRIANILIDKSADYFDIDINASVFETNIRVVGGLLSAHLLSKHAGMALEPGWPCSGPLLRMAENIARKLLPAFDTATGMPYGTVNLRHGVPKDETTVTCTAGVGTFIVEMATLSRLTGDPIFEKVAMRAMRALWDLKSPIGLVGNHIDVATGKWTAHDSGVGGGVDSYFEYLVKGSIMFQIPELLHHFREYETVIEKHLKRDDWYMWANMKKGGITLPLFSSLDAFWPGIQCMLGDVEKGMKTLHNFHQVWRQFGFLPEYYNIPKAETHQGREGYPLRPELIESIMYLYQGTKDPSLLLMGIDILESIEHTAKTACGYATVKDVRDHRLEDRMESFFLAETTKYLYLLFDSENFLHNKGSYGTVVMTPSGECIIGAGGYVFNTEAHPIDLAAVHCCSAQKEGDDQELQEFHDSLNILELMGIDAAADDLVTGSRPPTLTRQEVDTPDRHIRGPSPKLIKEALAEPVTAVTLNIVGDLGTQQESSVSQSAADTEASLAATSEPRSEEQGSGDTASEPGNEEQGLRDAESELGSEGQEMGDGVSELGSEGQEMGDGASDLVSEGQEMGDGASDLGSEGQGPGETDADTAPPRKTTMQLAARLLQLFTGKFPALEEVQTRTPNVVDLYRTMKDYSLNYTAEPALFHCPALPFYMRLSVMGEMFADE